MRVWLRVFGCRANQYDGEQVRAMLERAGHELVDDPAAADTAVINSCAVTVEAEAETRQAARRAARSNPAVRTIVMGCGAAISPRSGSPLSLHDLPGVAAVVPGDDVPGVARALGLVGSSARAASQSGTRALLRIQDGCDEHCTFCATTLARGASRSRAVADIVGEARVLAERHREIVLTGVHIGSYGVDVRGSLGLLLERLVRDVAGVRFRLTSVEASEVDDRLRELLRSDPRLVAPCLHAPLQSGSDRMLRRMGRHWYTAERYASAVERLVDGMSIFGLGADIITGFPGESEADHRATLDLVERLPFSGLHVFPWSPRPGTAAMKLGERVPVEAARARAAELREVAQRKARRYMELRGGTEADVLVLGAGREGFTEDGLTVRLDRPEPRGTIVRARLDWRAGSLVAMPPAPRVASLP